MNIMKFTGKTIAVCFAACIAAAALSACGDKKTDDADEQVDAQGMEMQDLEMKPASEAEVLEVLAFLPDPVATVYGEPIARKEITDELVSQGIPLEIYKRIGEERLRQEMNTHIERTVKHRVVLRLAEKAGFKPSPEFVINEMKEEFEGLPKEVQEEFEADLKEQGLSLEDDMKQFAQNVEVQEAAALRKYIHTTFLDKAKKEVSDADVKKEYEDHIAELTTPEGISVAHILIQSDNDEDDADAKAEIDAIYEELLKDPSQFGKLAQEKSDCPSGKADEGKLPAFDRTGMRLDGSGAMIKDFVDAAFSIEKPGQITKPVKTAYGYHIIKLLEKIPEEVTPLEKIKDNITEYLAAEKAQNELNKVLDDEIAKNVKINDFAPAKKAPAAE